MQVVLSIPVILVDLSFPFMHVTASVTIIQLEVSAELLQVIVSALNMWVTSFIVFMQVAVCCSYAGGTFCRTQLFGLMATMAQWLRCWIPNPGVLCSKPLGGFEVNSAFCSSEVNKTSTSNFWELHGKK